MSDRRASWVRLSTLTLAAAMLAAGCATSDNGARPPSLMSQPTSRISSSATAMATVAAALTALPDPRQLAPAPGVKPLSSAQVGDAVRRAASTIEARLVGAAAPFAAITVQSVLVQDPATGAPPPVALVRMETARTVTLDVPTWQQLCDPIYRTDANWRGLVVRIDLQHGTVDTAPIFTGGLSCYG